MHNVILMKSRYTFDDGEECIEDFLFIKMNDVVSPLSIFDLCFKGRLFLSIEKAIIVPNGSEKRRMRDRCFGVYVR